MGKDSFGSLLRYYRRKSRDTVNGGPLSQERLADLLSLESGIIYSRGAISDWERGKGHIHKDARHLLVSLLRVLVEAGGIQSVQEADAWLEAGNYRALNAKELGQVSAEWLTSTTATPFPRNDTAFMAPALPNHTVVGRTDLLAQIKSQFTTNSDRPLIVIQGMGGVGKTTLAIVLAYELHQHFSDGVLWGDLRLSVADGVLESWGQIFGIEMQGLSDLSSRAARMRGVFSTRKLLVVLDDVVDASEVQKMLPPMHSESAVIVTTRSTEVARLLANQEQIVSLTPMSRPNSLTIMRGILGRAVVEAQLSDADRVSALLGDLPLALQIGVALCVDTGLTLAELARLLDDLSTRLDYLQTGNRATVRLAFEQSWNMLDTVLRRAFAVLAVFEGRMFSAEDFAACIDMPQANAILLLAQLQRRSLLQCIDSGERQYQQHTLLAAYATEKLLSEDDAWLRFSHYFYTFAAHHLTNNLSFQDCWEQVMAGMQTAHRLQKSSLVLDYWQLLHPEWKQRGHYSSTRQSAAWALDAAEIEGDVSLQAAIALAWGVACLEQTDYVAAQQHLNNALDAFGLLRDDLGIADTHYQLSRVMLEQGESSSAETAIQLAWQHYQAVEDVRGMGRSLYRRANIHCYRGDFQPAISLLDDAVRWLSDVGDSRGLLRTHILATRTHSELGNLEQAQVHCAIASELSDQLNERAESASFYYSYAALCRTQGDYSRAHDFAQKALALFREMYDVKSEANALNLLAGIEMHWNRALPERREFENGLAYCQQGIALCDRSGYTLGKAFLLLINGHLLLQRGELQHACQTWWRGFEVARDLEHAWLQVRFSQLAEEHGC